MNVTHRRCTLPSGHVVALVLGDITDEEADALVNAANARLCHGDGVAGAILRKGGPAIDEESEIWVRNHGPVSHAEPAITGPGDLRCRAVIHAVGPVWGDGDEDGKLAAAIRGSLDMAERKGFASIALPALSTGVFGFPCGRAAAVITETVETWCALNPGSAVREVRFVLFDEGTLELFDRELENCV